MKTIKFGKNIYPDVDQYFEKSLELLERYEIQMNPLFEEGIAFTYPSEKYEVQLGDGLIFVDPVTAYQLIKIVESFGELDILDSDDSVIGKINLLEEL